MSSKRCRFDRPKHGYRERSAQPLGELAEARLSSPGPNQSVIQFLNHPLKDRVDRIDEILDTVSNFYQELYQEESVDVSS